jgi:hypothetical protein
MITFKLQFILIVISILSLAYVLYLIMKYELGLKYAMLWMLLNGCLLVLSVFPVLSTKIAQLMGIEAPVNMLFLIAIFFIFGIIFSLTVSLSRYSSRIKLLSQEIGLMKLEIQSLRADAGRSSLIYTEKQEN